MCVCTCLSYQAELVNASNTHACTCMSVPLCALSVCACVCVYSCTHASKQIFTYVLCGRVGEGNARRASIQAVNDIKTGDKEEERERGGRTNLSIFNQYLSGAKRGTRSAEEEGGRGGGEEREEEKGKEEEEEGEEASGQ